MSGIHVANPDGRIATVTCTTVNMEFQWAKFFQFQKSSVCFCKSIAMSSEHDSEAEVA